MTYDETHSESSFANSLPAMLFIAHPGHELVVYKWLSTVKPVVHIMTDGSGGTSAPRINSTRQLLDEVQCPPGGIFGLFSDRELYSDIMSGRTSTFCELAVRLADTLVQHDIQLVAGDAYEGMNPIHDVCRMIINAATQLAFKRYGRKLLNYCFSLYGNPLLMPKQESVLVTLTENDFRNKTCAATTYEEIASEVLHLARLRGEQSFRSERMVMLTGDFLEPDGSVKPLYERYGEMQVVNGLYKEVLRFREHILPVWHALASAVESDEYAKPVIPGRGNLAPALMGEDSGS